VIGKCLWLYLWPAHLSSDYSYNQIPVTADWQGVLSLAVCAAAAVAAIFCFRRTARMPYKPLFFCIAFFFAALAPTSNLILLIGTIMAERFLYLPSIGLAGCLAMGILAVSRRLASRRSRTVAALLVTALSLAFAARTFVRNFDWLDGWTLSAASVESAPNSFKTHQGLAHDELTLKNPNFDLAVTEADRAVAIVADLPDDRSSSHPYHQAGEADRRKGDALPEGPARQQWYGKALEVLLRGQKIDLALREVASLANQAHGRRVISAAWEPLYMELGRVYERLGEWDKALEALSYGRSIKLQPAFFDEIARVYRLKGDNRQAGITLMEALVADPSVTVFASQLVEIYTQSDPQSCAVRRTGGAASLDLGCPLVHDQLCTAAHNVALLYVQSGKRDQAGATARTAVEEMGCSASLFQ
jgi:tetratricopeptide (TPR) repeat protein